MDLMVENHGARGLLVVARPYESRHKLTADSKAMAENGDGSSGTETGNTLATT